MGNAAWKESRRKGTHIIKKTVNRKMAKGDGTETTAQMHYVKCQGQPKEELKVS